MLLRLVARDIICPAVLVWLAALVIISRPLTRRQLALLARLGHILVLLVRVFVLLALRVILIPVKLILAALVAHKVIIAKAGGIYKLVRLEPMLMYLGGSVRLRLMFVVVVQPICLVWAVLLLVNFVQQGRLVSLVLLTVGP